jgi:hypothetical protein
MEAAAAETAAAAAARELMPWSGGGAELAAVMGGLKGEVRELSGTWIVGTQGERMVQG